MAITSGAILTRVNQITKRDVTDIDEILKEALVEISERTDCLKSSTTGTLSADTNTITEPSDLIDIDELYLDDELLNPITLAEWREGKINGYARWNNTIYVNPEPNTDKNYTLYYSKRHALSTTIEYGDEFQPAIVWLVAMKLYENYEIDEKALRAERKYERELAKISPDEAIGVSRQHSKSRIR